MKSHSRPFKCDQEGCSFAQLGFSTQAHLRTHHAQYHGQKFEKPRALKYRKSKRQELKVILIDAIREGDVQTVRDMWDLAKPFRTTLLLAAVQERSSGPMLDMLIERAPYAADNVMTQKSLSRKHAYDLYCILKAAIATDNATIVGAFGIQQLLSSRLIQDRKKGDIFLGQVWMSNIINMAATRRNPHVVGIIAPQIPNIDFGLFMARIFPTKPDEEAEMATIQCIHRFRHLRAYKESVLDILKLLGFRCCSIPIAKLLLEDGAYPDGTHNTGYTALFAAAANTDRNSAEFIKFLLEQGAEISFTWKGQGLSDRPAARTFQKWLGLSLDDLINMYKKDQHPETPSQSPPLTVEPESYRSLEWDDEAIAGNEEQSDIFDWSN
ncbi:putative SOM1 protein [Colletotrichum tabaci]|uniref:SOM1 protein n=1 Tax=Colletotrichum tabaci TaxID=1209068 RepID=A0AAV9TNR9_9PEZI